MTSSKKRLRPLTSNQQLLLSRLKAGWKIEHRRTSTRRRLNSIDFSWGTVLSLLRKGDVKISLKVDHRTLDSMITRGLVEGLERPSPIDTSSLEALMRSQDTPYENYRITAAGRKA